MKNNSTQPILRLDQIYNFKNIHSGPADYYTADSTWSFPVIFKNEKHPPKGKKNYTPVPKTWEYEPYPMVLSTWNGSRSYQTKHPSGGKNPIYSESMLRFLGFSKTNTQKNIKPNNIKPNNIKPNNIKCKTNNAELLVTENDSARLYQKNLGINFQGGRLKKDSWLMKSSISPGRKGDGPFFQHVAWNMKHEILTPFLNSAYFFSSAPTPLESGTDALVAKKVLATKPEFLQNSGLNIYGGSWYFDNLTFPYIGFSSLLEKNGPLNPLNKETNNFTPHSIKSWCFARMGMRKIGFVSSLPLASSKLDFCFPYFKQFKGEKTKDEYTYLELLSNRNGSLSSKLNDQDPFWIPRTIDYNPETKRESQLHWKEPEGPDIGIYSLAHKLASLGLHRGNSDTDIYPFKYNDYYRYNFQSKRIKSFPTYFSSSKKFLDFKNPSFSKIYAPLFQPQGLNLLSFVSQKIIPSIDPSLPNFSINSLNNNPDTTIWNAENKNWDEKILIGNNFPSESRFIKKHPPGAYIKKPSIFFSSFRHLPYFLLSEKTSTEQREGTRLVPSAFDKLNSRAESPSTSFRELEQQMDRPEMLLVRQEFDLGEGKAKKKDQQRKYNISHPSGAETLFQFDDDSVSTAPLHKSFTIKPLSAFIKKEIGYQMSRFQVTKINFNKNSGKEIKRSMSIPSFFSAERNPYFNKDKVTLQENLWTIFPPLFQHLSFRFVDLNLPRTWFSDFRTHGRSSISSLREKRSTRLQKSPVELSRWTGKPKLLEKIKQLVPIVSPNQTINVQPKFSVISDRFKELQKQTPLGDNSSYYKKSKQKPEQQSYTNLARFDNTLDEKGSKGLTAKVRCRPLIQKNFFRFSLPFSFSDFFRLKSLPLNENNQSFVKNKQFESLPVNSELQNQTPIESNNNSYTGNNSSQKHTLSWSLLKTTQNGSQDVSQKVTANNKNHSYAKKYFLFYPREENNFTTFKGLIKTSKDGNTYSGVTSISPKAKLRRLFTHLDHPGGVNNKDKEREIGNEKLFQNIVGRNPKRKALLNNFDNYGVKRAADTNSSDHAFVLAEPIVNYYSPPLQGGKKTKIYPFNVSRHNELNSKIGVYGEKPLLKTRTTHGPPLKNQKESISLPNYLKNITNQNYQNLCPNQLKDMNENLFSIKGFHFPTLGLLQFMIGGGPFQLYFVFWILFSKTLFIYLSLHYLRKFITFLGTEYIRNLFKIFVTMKFIDGNILSIIKTFQDFNFQLNQQNVIDIKVNKQLKTVKRY